MARVTFLAIALLLSVTAVLPSRAEADPGVFLVDFGKRAAAELNDPALDGEQRERRFRALFNEAVDLHAIGKFVLGPHWRRASKQERGDFLAAFEDIALQRFLPMFTRETDEYRGEAFEVVGIRRGEGSRGHLFVETRVDRAEGDPVKLIWRMREREGGYKILDISVEGLSMILTLRKEYDSAVNQAGGVAGLVELMRSKVRAGAFAPKAATVAE